MAVTYTTGLGLCIVGILRKYHASLLVSQEQTSSAFDRFSNHSILLSFNSVITVFSFH
jgi:hypothetical protein